MMKIINCQKRFGSQWWYDLVIKLTYKSDRWLKTSTLRLVDGNSHRQTMLSMLEM